MSPTLRRVSARAGGSHLRLQLPEGRRISTQCGRLLHVFIFFVRCELEGPNPRQALRGDLFQARFHLREVEFFFCALPGEPGLKGGRPCGRGG